MLAEAEQAARTLTQRAPQHGFGWKALGLILSRLDRKNEALPAMQQAAKLLPRDAEAFNNLGALFEEFHRLDLAQSCYQHASEVNASFEAALDNLIRLVEKQDRPQELLPLLKRKLKAALAWCERINALTPEQRGCPPWHYVLLAENVVYEWQAKGARLAELLDYARDRKSVV